MNGYTPAQTIKCYCGKEAKQVHSDSHITWWKCAEDHYISDIYLPRPEKVVSQETQYLMDFIKKPKFFSDLNW